MKAIEKKHFELPTPTGLKRVFANYLSKNRCWDYHHIQSVYSRINAIMNSGATTTIIEYKERNQAMPYYWNQSSMLERSKYDTIITIAFSLNAQALFVMEFTEAVLIYDLCQDHRSYKWESKECPVESGEKSNVYIQKQVTYLSFADADFIVSKKDWLRKTKEDLAYYLKEIKRRNEETERTIN